jgi:uncharacterized metal-binding protein YceD (DUF177 family)
MPVRVNLRHLEEDSVHVEGEIDPKELDLMLEDEVIRAESPLKYDLEVERQNQNLLVQGKLQTTLDCQCVRCLKPFKYKIILDPYDAFIPLEGEDRAAVENDLVDLTPYLREDTLLAFPRHPVCEAECDRLPQVSRKDQAGEAMQESKRKAAWDQLDKLKL